jgi:hypothetical protein
MKEVAYRSPILSSQFDYYLRAVAIPYELVTSKAIDQMLIQIDPLEIPENSPLPKETIPADVVNFIDM